jgi:hypothetical protein
MSRDAAAIIADLKRYFGTDSTWLDLDILVQELFLNPIGAAELDALFGVFERHPTHDGFGLFWKILHGIESVSTYEPCLLRSLRRRPSLFAVYMINRILNVGIQEVQGGAWISALHEVSLREDIEQEIRDEADMYLKRDAN